MNGRQRPLLCTLYATHSHVGNLAEIPRYFETLVRAYKLRNHTRGEGKNRDFPWLEPQNIITLARMQEDFAHFSRAFK